MFITPAYAQAAGAPGAQDFLTSMIPLVLIFVIFYFLLIRPQQKRAKAHQAMLDALRRGDQVVTAGGIIAKVARVREDGEVELDIAEGVKVRVVRSTIASVLAKTDPAKAEPANTTKAP